MAGSHERVNLMLEQSASVVTDKHKLLAELGALRVDVPMLGKKSI